MPTVVINDVELEAKIGEQLLNVARRNAVHIGFICDGNGVCQTCQCRVLDGADQLSPPSAAERAWMPERRLAEGHRLACQVALRGPGPVRVLTTVEELRRQTLNLLSPPPGEDWRDQIEPLLDKVVRDSVDQIALHPFNLVSALLRVGPLRFAYPLLNPERWADDGLRVARRMLSAEEGPERPAAAPRPASPAEEQLLVAARELQRARAAVERLNR
jgi:ferredoxin